MRVNDFLSRIYFGVTNIARIGDNTAVLSKAERPSRLSTPMNQNAFICDLIQSTIIIIYYQKCNLIQAGQVWSYSTKMNPYRYYMCFTSRGHWASPNFVLFFVKIQCRGQNIFVLKIDFIYISLVNLTENHYNYFWSFIRAKCHIL